MEAKRITVADVMTKEPITLRYDDVLDLASDIMSLARIRHLPVVDGEKVVGVLSQRDLFHSALRVALGLDYKKSREILKTIYVREVMSAPATTISADGEAQHAARIMVERKIGCLPVVKNDRLIGLVTETDILRCFAAL